MPFKDDNGRLVKDEPVALILAGYNKIDFETKRRRNKEIKEANDGDEIYMGENKFLRFLNGKPIIQYVLDAVYNAKKNGKQLYDKIYIYNDVKSFNDVIDVSNYPNVIVKQMKDSVGGHWKDFYFNEIDYGQRVDVFFGDIPRIKSEDVEYIHEEINEEIYKGKDHRNIPVSMIFHVAEFEDLDDNWLEHRIKYIRVGKNKGKLKSFVGLENYQARVGNGGAIFKDKCLDGLMENEAVNYIYNVRKALTPSSFSKIVYYLLKSGHRDMIKQVKNKCINESQLIDAVLDVTSRLYKIDLSDFAVTFLHIKKNASRWENDVDGPKDYDKFKEKFKAIKGT